MSRPRVDRLAQLPRETMAPEMNVGVAWRAWSRACRMGARLLAACAIDRDMIALYESDFPMTYGR